jgi:hypothetical protein
LKPHVDYMYIFVKCDTFDPVRLDHKRAVADNDGGVGGSSNWSHTAQLAVTITVIYCTRSVSVW